MPKSKSSSKQAESLRHQRGSCAPIRPWRQEKTKSLPDIVTVDQAQRIFAATRVVSYRVLFFTLYSLGLRLGEGLRLQVGISRSMESDTIDCATGCRIPT
ncbi:hypothetical protein [Propionivibrio sp.]|uniref:hypothetical protein n=1 Tax=Propionivibrio sp. TaxID=2212460 RepID=UPI003BEF83D9